MRESLAGIFSQLWQAVRGVELVLAEVATEFEGADPLKPAKRETLGALRARLRCLGEELISLGVKVDMMEPDEELLDLLRRLVSDFSRVSGLCAKTAGGGL